MRRFLVIDDSQERKDAYCRAFNFLELDFAFSSKEFLDKIKEKYDGYFVDVIYVDESFGEFSFQEILPRIPQKKPLVIVSGNWQEAIDNIKMRFLRESGKANDVIGYISWNNIEDPNRVEITKDYIREQINHFYNFAFNAFDENQCVSILQISDIEFGNPGQEGYVETAKKIIIREVRTALKKLNFQQGKVDFICVCGDIAYTGEKAEYEKAKKWLRELGNQLLVNSNFENMIIVPGNHDYNYNSAAGTFLQYNKDTQDYEQREDVKFDYHDQAMYNFARFAYELTGETSYLIEPYKPIVKRTYEEYGFNFILLNPIKISREKKFKYGMNDIHMQTLLDDFDKYNQEEMCNIMLSHVEPKQYNMVDSSSDSINKELVHIINELNIKGWFYGHSHDKRFVDDIRIGNHKVMLSRTGTLMLSNGEHCEGAGNGFTVIKLYREGGRVYKMSYWDDMEEKEITTPFEK